MAIPIALIYLKRTAIQTFLNVTAEFIDSAYTSATNLAHLPNNPFGNLMITSAFQFLADLFWIAVLIFVTISYIVVPCLVVALFVTWAFHQCIEGRLRTGDSWFTKETWGDDRGKLVGYDDEKGELKKVVVEVC